MENDQDLSPLLGTQQNQLSIVIDDGSSIDTKSLAVAAINVTLLLFAAQAKLTLHRWQVAAYVLPLLASLFCNALGALPKKYIGASIDLADHPEYLAMGSQQLLLQLIVDTQNAINRNLDINRRFWRYCLVSIGLTICGTIVLFAILKV